SMDEMTMASLHKKILALEDFALLKSQLADAIKKLDKEADEKTVELTREATLQKKILALDTELEEARSGWEQERRRKEAFKSSNRAPRYVPKKKASLSSVTA
ncbi:hypothetical protein PENTCL1PPCAC_20205, partial [Pristionchus entomophagus]